MILAAILTEVLTAPSIVTSRGTSKARASTSGLDEFIPKDSTRPSQNSIKVYEKALDTPTSSYDGGQTPVKSAFVVALPIKVHAEVRFSLSGCFNNLFLKTSPLE